MRERRKFDDGTSTVGLEADFDPGYRNRHYSFKTGHLLRGQENRGSAREPFNILQAWRRGRRMRIISRSGKS